MSAVLWEGENEDQSGHSVLVTAEDDGMLAVTLSAPGASMTIAFEDDAVNELQLALAAYLHHKNE